MHVLLLKIAKKLLSLHGPTKLVEINKRLLVIGNKMKTCRISVNQVCIYDGRHNENFF
jgi:hypothetical protein